MITDILFAKNPYKGKRFTKFGLEQFVEDLISMVVKKYNMEEVNPRGVTSGLHATIKKFLSNPETDLETIQERQKLLKVLINDQPLQNFLLTEKVPEIPSDDYEERDLCQYDNVASQTASYLEKFHKLISTKTEYLPLQKKLTTLWRKNPWLKEVKKIATNNPKYSACIVKISVTMSRDASYGREYYKGKSSTYNIEFIPETGNSTTTVLNRMKFDFYVENQKIALSNIEETRRLFSLSSFSSLLTTSFNAKTLLTSKEITLHITIRANIQTGEITATTKQGKNPALILIPARYKTDTHQENVKWIPLEQSTEKLKPRIDHSLLHGLKIFSLEPSFAGSRRHLKTLRRDFLNLFDELGNFRTLAFLAAYFRLQERKSVFPVMLPKENMVTKIKAGCNPAFANKGKCIPNDLDLNPKKAGYVLTGANTGGKTGYTNMVALSQILAQAGLPIFAKSAQLSVKDEILCHYIETNDVKTNLSRYASEMRRLRKIIKEVTKFSLVLFDEPFSGTSAASGTEKAYDVVRALAKVECSFIMNTHFHDLIEKVGTNGTSTIANYHFLLPKKGNPNSFKLLPGGIKISYGEDIAKNEEVDYESMIALLQERGVLPVV